MSDALKRYRLVRVWRRQTAWIKARPQLWLRLREGKLRQQRARRAIIGERHERENTRGELARDCDSYGRNEFMFIAPVLQISGAVASPTNPLAIK